MRSARLYLGALNARAAGRRVAEAVFDGLWLGVMDRGALAEIDAAFYDRATEEANGARHRYADEPHIRAGLHQWEAEIVGEAFPDGARVIVTAAGAGREVLALLGAGYDAVGFEPHPGLVAEGRTVLAQTGADERLRPCPRDVFPAVEERADAVIVGWGSYGLIPGRRRRLAFLKDAHASLPPGAPLLLSFFVRPRRRYFGVVLRVGNALRRVRRDEALELGDALTPNFAHYFTRHELEEELRAGGFELRAFKAQPYGHALASRR
jgi:hypothetical protein